MYNRVLGFEMALESAIAVKGCTEIIIVDDNSTHAEFSEIIARYKDNRIKFYKNTNNLGLFGNWNQCIKYASSDFVSILCSDDLVDNKIYDLFLEAYQDNEAIDVFFGSFATFKHNIADARLNLLYPKGPMSSFSLLENALKNGLGFPVLSVMRRKVMLTLPFVAEPHSGNDWLWIYSNATALNLYATDQPINYWRRHDEQDAIKNQNITRNCWPLLFINISNQLKSHNASLSKKALHMGKGVILTLLLNERNGERFLLNALTNDENHDIFLDAMHELIEKDWLLRIIIKTKGKYNFTYNCGRLLRKLMVYPSNF